MNDKLNISFLTTAYLPPVEYISIISRSQISLIEKCENYQKQSYRNRCHIYGACGILPLIIPVSREENHSGTISGIKIDYSREWQKQHWRAILSAYKSSPFFDYYQDDLFPFYEKKENYLFDFNFKLLKTILTLLETDSLPGFTNSYIKEYPNGDFRELIHPKKQAIFSINENGQYHQVFAHKHGFIPNLSILDLLFNEGPNAISFL